MKWLCWIFPCEWEYFEKRMGAVQQREDAPKIIQKLIDRVNEKGGPLNQYRRCVRCGHEQVAGVILWHYVSK